MGRRTVLFILVPPGLRTWVPGVTSGQRLPGWNFVEKQQCVYLGRPPCRCRQARAWGQAGCGPCSSAALRAASVGQLCCSVVGHSGMDPAGSEMPPETEAQLLGMWWDQRWDTLVLLMLTLSRPSTWPCPLFPACLLDGWPHAPTRACTRARTKGPAPLGTFPPGRGLSHPTGDREEIATPVLRGSSESPSRLVCQSRSLCVPTA